ncbi:HET-domain-containing protein [Zalerion maritima]|uniref:HET-domain-containing protein n=1 Tax=Zalerion maritima TaxID=339359 RepID=A0AAD5RSY7_9PEZI|nr:HET-domain-containing protein [Zalerion maritima]
MAYPPPPILPLLDPKIFPPTLPRDIDIPLRLMDSPGSTTPSDWTATSSPFFRRPTPPPRLVFPSPWPNLDVVVPSSNLLCPVCRVVTETVAATLYATASRDHEFSFATPAYARLYAWSLRRPWASSLPLFLATFWLRWCKVPEILRHLFGYYFTRLWFLPLWIWSSSAALEIKTAGVVDENCSLCKLFEVALVPKGLADFPYGFCMESFMYSATNGRGLPGDISFATGRRFHREDLSLYLTKVKTTFLGPSHYNVVQQISCSSHSGGSSREISTRFVPARVDVGPFHQWLDACRHFHGEVCNYKSSNSRVWSLRGIRFIDCKTRELVPAPPNSRYITLSYVWGKPSSGGDGVTPQQPSSPSTLANMELPPTIEDAIQLTGMLGYQYLWVDKYCIDQGNAQEKHQQICNMDLIYKESEITIVAAEGEDQNAGLPGVTTERDRGRCARVAVSDLDVSFTHTVVETHPQTDARKTIQKSKWMTRGWTFQEAVLSRRALCFTAKGVYFECKRANFFEGLRTPDYFTQAIPGEVKGARGEVVVGDSQYRPRTRIERLLWGKPRAKIFPCLEPGLFAGISYSMPGWESPTTLGYHIYWKLAVDYSKRSLTFESDALLAFAGIIRDLANQNLKHVAGLPYVDSGGSLLTGSFLHSLCWLSWPPNSAFSAKRREGFPTWTWAGWKLSLITPGELGQDPNILIESLRFVFSDGQVVDFETYSRHHSNNSILTFPSLLKLEGYRLHSCDITSCMVSKSGRGKRDREYYYHARGGRFTLAFVLDTGAEEAWSEFLAKEAALSGNGGTAGEEPPSEENEIEPNWDLRLPLIFFHRVVSFVALFSDRSSSSLKGLLLRKPGDRDEHERIGHFSIKCDMDVDKAFIFDKSPSSNGSLCEFNIL